MKFAPLSALVGLPLLLALAACAPATAPPLDSSGADATAVSCTRDEDCPASTPVCGYRGEAGCTRVCVQPPVPTGAGPGELRHVCTCEGQVAEAYVGADPFVNRVYDVGPSSCSEGGFERCTETAILGRPCRLEGEAASAENAEVVSTDLGKFAGLTLRAVKGGTLDPSFSETIPANELKKPFQYSAGTGFFVDRNGDGVCDRGEPAIPYYRSITDDGSRQHINLVSGVPLPECSELR